MLVNAAHRSGLQDCVAGGSSTFDPNVQTALRIQMPGMLLSCCADGALELTCYNDCKLAAGRRYVAVHAAQ